MGTAAVAARMRLPIAGRRAAAAPLGLAFDEPGGPLVAVCGLVGGSGASTLAFCLARQAARDSTAPVLLTESDAGRAGLAVLARQAAPVSLAGLARRLADGQPPRQPFVEIESGLRLLASAPGRMPAPDPVALSAVLDDARAAHGLVVVDCGAAWSTAGAVLEAATHIVWTVSASAAAIAHATSLVASDALPAAGRRREVLVALVTERRPGARVRALRRLAGERCERLVLVPHSEALARGELADASGTLSRALMGIGHVIRRQP
jgi:Flp pilus assembly CpaE family ATPase